MPDLRSFASPLPSAAWALAWTSLAAEVLVLVDRGVSDADETSIVVSMVLSGAVVAWVSAGVLTGRGVRLFLVWLVLALSLIADTITALDGFDGSGWSLVHLAATGLQVVALVSFVRTDFFRAQRARSAAAPPLGSILVIAVAAGAIGGLVGTQHADTDEQCRWHGKHRVVACGRA